MKKNTPSCLVRWASVAAVQLARLLAMATVVAAGRGSRPGRRQTLTTHGRGGCRVCDSNSAKVSEYNGLFSKGVYGIFNFDWRGGAGYDSDSTTRYRVTATDLGLHMRHPWRNRQTGHFPGVRGFRRIAQHNTDTYQSPIAASDPTSSRCRPIG